MKKFIAIFTFSLLLPNLCLATSLDDIYRDLVKSNNQGYLPVFVKNRNAPNFLDEEELSKHPLPKEKDKQDFEEPLSLNNERKLRNEEKVQEIQAWKDAVEAIKANQVTPANLREIEKRVAIQDPKATEIYAWMLARGVGMDQDLPKSFEMYLIANQLKAPEAIKNAALIYKAMTPEQRSNIKPFNPSSLAQAD